MDTANFLTALNAFGAQVITLLSEGLDAAKAALPGFMSQAMVYWVSITVFNTIMLTVLIFVLSIVSYKAFRVSYRIQHYDNVADSHEREILHVAYCADHEFYWGVVGAISVIVGVTLFLILICWAIPECIKMITAPSLFFLEHAKAMFK